QGFGRGEAGCSDGRVQAGQRADDQGGRDGAAYGPGGHHGGPALQAGVPGGDRGAEQHAGAAAEGGQQHRFGEELEADGPAGGAEGASQPDLGAAFQDCDHHGVGDADAANQQGDRVQAQQQAGEGDLGGGLGCERVGGAGDVDLVGLGRVGGAGQQAAYQF